MENPEKTASAAAGAAPRMRYLSMQVAEPRGPVVEVKFLRGVDTEDDVKGLVKEARAWTEQNVGRGRKAYFLNCYDHLNIPLKLVDSFKRGFFEFNQSCSKGDVRYGGGVSTKAFWISTAIKEGVSSNFYATREEALEVLRAMAARDTA